MLLPQIQEELNLSSIGFDSDGSLGLNEFMVGLKQAATDDNIQGILLDQGMFSAGYGALEELGDYLKEFKDVSVRPSNGIEEINTKRGANLQGFPNLTILHPAGYSNRLALGMEERRGGEEGKFRWFAEP